MTTKQNILLSVHRSLVGEGVRHFSAHRTNPRLTGLPGDGSLYVTRTLPHARSSRHHEFLATIESECRASDTGWAALLHPRERMGWFVTMPAVGFVHLLGAVGGDVGTGSAESS
jgi:hypothetical protein